MEEVASDAAAARHLAAARDRDLADFAVKIDANRQAINALGVQTAARFDRLEQETRNGFTEMRGRLDAAAAGQQQIVALLNTLIDQQGEQPEHDRAAPRDACQPTVTNYRCLQCVRVRSSSDT